MSNLSCCVSHQTLNFKLPPPEKKLERGTQTAATRGEMRRLFVGGLSHTVTQKELKDRFGKFGDVVDVELRTRRDEEGEKMWGRVLMLSSSVTHKHAWLLQCWSPAARNLPKLNDRFQLLV